jgi:exodeoxyribonuclease VII large subunit
MNDSAKITLTELQEVIRDRLYEALPGFFWVVAEIAELKVNSSGHCYLELTDSDMPDGRVSARARATIWAAKYRSLNTFFNASAGIPLRAGITILFKAKVEYHEIYGLSLNITDIDPAYTAGDMALRREAIVRRLTQEGVMAMNRELTLTPYPRYIAVISSAKAAGYQDFISHLARNPYGYIFVPHLFEAVMQGETTELSVINALNDIAGEISHYDAAVIIRGGGSSADLSWFDSYDIAYHVTQFPIPVITGIGHDKDLSVTDLVAWRPLKTPTAVADFLITHTAECENHIVEMAYSLSSTADEIITSAEEQLASLLNRTASTARLHVRVKNEVLVHYTDTLVRSKNNTLRSAEEITGRMEQSLRHLDPAGVLKRGYTITSRRGKIIGKCTELMTGDIIVTHFEDGKATSIVNETSNNR